MNKDQVKKFYQFVKENEVAYADFRFTDPKGKLQHITYDVRKLDKVSLEEGLMIDGSSISGWKEVDESDMIIKPDFESMFIDPFTLNNTICIFSDVVEPRTGKGYERDPRSTAGRAEEYLKDTGIGDISFFGPEAEFFIFDQVSFDVSMNKAFYSLNSEEGSYNSGRESNNSNNFPNLGHRPRLKGGYFPVQPVDSMHEIRAEMLERLSEVGVTPILHHHEVASGQCELGIEYSSLKRIADFMQTYKYVVHNVASEHNKTATFMPKPISGDNGSGMHCHQSIWKDGRNIFFGDKYSNLSQECLWYIGGIIKHAKAINAFANPTTNSYKRLVPGFEAPVHLAYSSLNRSASIRIPHVHSKESTRIECRFPDPSANPYYAFSAMLMAGLDGIKNKIDPGEPCDKNLYSMSTSEISHIPRVARSLHEALDSLSSDYDFLLQGGVFTEDQINAYVKLKMLEVTDWESNPHPIEFVNYYSV